MQRLEQAQEALSAKDRGLEQTQEALRKQLGENAELSRQLVGLQQLVESYKAREAANRPLLDVIEETVKQLKGQP
jgi:hypothetical protein